MRTFGLLLICFLSLDAMTLERFVDTSLSRHPSLLAIASRIAAADAAVRRAKNFDNPVLGLFVNDLPLNDLTDRRIEPMQTQGVTIAQKIPGFGKREAKEAVALARKGLQGLKLQEARTLLETSIVQEAWRLWELTKLFDITQKTLRLTRQKVDLFTAYTASSDTPSAHTALMSAELVVSRLKIALAKIEGQIEASKARLRYLGDVQGELPKLTMPKHDLPALAKLLERIDRSPTLQVQKGATHLQAKRLDAVKLSTRLNPVVKAGYNHRSAFEDYLSISVGVALPIYGTETSRIEQNRALLMAKRSETVDLRKKLSAKVENLWYRAKAQADIIEILQRKSLPEIDHMFELMASRIQAGGDLYRFVDLLEQKFRLEAKLIVAIAAKERTIATIESIVPQKRNTEGP